jgi:hypothetical protein
MAVQDSWTGKVKAMLPLSSVPDLQPAPSEWFMIQSRDLLPDLNTVRSCFSLDPLK